MLFRNSNCNLGFVFLWFGLRIFYFSLVSVKNNTKISLKKSFQNNLAGTICFLVCEFLSFSWFYCETALDLLRKGLVILFSSASFTLVFTKEVGSTSEKE
ncbi:hypothetical protein K1719_029960, partial [Acacia pycnantha]